MVTQVPFEETEEYTNLQGQIDELLTKRDEKGDATEATQIFAKNIVAINAKISTVNEGIAATKAAEATKERIAELEQRTRDVAKEFEQVERGIHLCEEFTRTKARLVTESINKHFSRVRFILFRDQINGGLREVCEPTGINRDGQWVEYRSLNFADKINTQLDIVNTLNKHYGVNLPVIMDQGESVTNPMPIDEQFIRLIVSAADSENFRIEHK